MSQTYLGKFKKTEIIPSIFSSHKDIKLGINNRRKAEVHKSMGFKQYAPQQPMGQARSKKGNQEGS